MAIYKSNTNLVIPLLAFITIFLMLLNRVNSADSLSFNFTHFDPDQKDLILQGDATIPSNSQGIQLTTIDASGKPSGYSVGRALYSAPVRLWKGSSGSAVVANFDTTFTFVISPNSSTPADGLTFFLASPDSTIPTGSNGAFFGLFSPANNALNNNSLNQINVVDDFKASSDKVVAVEFDTYPNPDLGDPAYSHIGIDINSVNSSETSRWRLKNGVTAIARVIYKTYSGTSTLTAVTAYPISEISVSVSYKVDLSTVLPEWVRVGFSGSTGQYAQTNNILSWSFSSSLKSIQDEKEDLYIASAV